LRGQQEQPARRKELKIRKTKAMFFWLCTVISSAADAMLVSGRIRFKSNSKGWFKLVLSNK